MKTTSKIFRLNWRDILKAAIIAVITPVLLVAQHAIDNGTMPAPKTLGMAALGGFGAYLIKNFFTDGKSTTGSDTNNGNTTT